MGWIKSQIFGGGGDPSRVGEIHKIKKAPKIPHVQVLKLPKKTKNKSHFWQFSTMLLQIFPFLQFSLLKKVWTEKRERDRERRENKKEKRWVSKKGKDRKIISKFRLLYPIVKAFPSYGRFMDQFVGGPPPHIQSFGSGSTWIRIIFRCRIHIRQFKTE